MIKYPYNDYVSQLSYPQRVQTPYLCLILLSSIHPSSSNKNYNEVRGEQINNNDERQNTMRAHKMKSIKKKKKYRNENLIF